MKKTRAKNLSDKKGLLPVIAVALCVLAMWACGLGRNTWVWERLEMSGLHFGDAENKTTMLNGMRLTTLCPLASTCA